MQGLSMINAAGLSDGLMAIIPGGIAYRKLATCGDQMIKRFALILLLSLTGTLIAKNAPRDEPTTLWLTHVTVIDVTGGPVQPDRTVITEGGRITSISKSSNLIPPLPSGVKLLDATGKFLIPGLWDMHVHWGETGYLPLFLANGVTGMRLMWGMPAHYEWRRQSAAGKLLAPHLVIASVLIDGPNPFWPGSVSVSTQAEARQAVDDAKKQGAEFVKVYTFLPREEYFAIADEAKKEGIPFAGHIPKSVTVEEASRAGQKSFEHLLGILPACTSRSEEFYEAAKADLVDDLAGPHPTFWGKHYKALRQAEIDAYNPQKAAALFALLKANGTWQVGTGAVSRSQVNGLANSLPIHGGATVA